MRLPLLLALFALPAFAEGPANLSPVTAQPGAASRLIEAHRLFQLGKAAHDPLLVLAAARLMQGVTLREVTRRLADPLPRPAEPDPKPEDKKDKPLQDPPPDPLPPPEPKVVPDPAQAAPLPGSLSPAALLAAARAMVPDKDPLGDVIADAEAQSPPPGQSVLVTSLIQSAAGNTTFLVPFAGESYGEIGLLRLSPDFPVIAAGHLTLTVTDAAGNLACMDASASASALCGIVPRETGNFRVTITNDGLAPAAYLLITN